MTTHVRVAVLTVVERAYDYEVPAAMSARVDLGTRVWVPFSGRALEGVVVALDPPLEVRRLKPLRGVIDGPPVSTHLVALAQWVAEYYQAPPGEVLRLVLPAGGAARGRRRARLTAEGLEVAKSLGAALEPIAAAKLGSAARRLLSALSDGPMPVERVSGLAAALRALEARGLVTVDESVHVAELRDERWLEVARPAQPAELSRAPRRAEAYALIAAAGGISLAALRRDDERLARQVGALVDAGLVRQTRRELRRDPLAGVPSEPDVSLRLTPDQEAALATIGAPLRERRYAPFLLFGVTGSGKTEIYLRVIAAARAEGKSALVLVPEIALTPQLAARFRSRFGDDVAVLHSGLGHGERRDAWRRVRRGEVAIVVGARSAVFAPLEGLGVVVVDEEHDPSFKQDEGVRYHGRDVALVRARMAGAVAILGSATPSLETFHAAREGRLTLLELRSRPEARPMPSVELIDLRVHRRHEGALLAAPLEAAIEETLAAGDQAILFLNRRGFSTFILCKGCGTAARCRDCSVTLTYHRAADRLLCHYCGFTTAVPRRCSSCGAGKLERLGVGTEQVEARVRERFPGARVARLDRDTTSELASILTRLRRREVDILVGTQMVSKGHDFPGVTLVGVVLADHGMGLPDFRAAERTFQLLSQVAGRAGRGDHPGRVLIQSYHPTHPAVVCAQAHDYRGFVASELPAREELGYPPYLRLACLRLDGADAGAVRAVAEAVAATAREMAGRAPAEERASVLGPSEAPLSRLKGRTRWQLFIKAARMSALRQIVRQAARTAMPRGVRLSVDIDPVSTL